MYRIAVFLLFSCALFAQTASVTGRVTDPSGGVVPGAKLTVQSIESGIATAVETNSDGYYSIPALQPGKYNLTATKPGFVTLKQTSLELEVQQTARIDLTLQVGAVSESIEVSAQAVLLESETATVGQVVATRQISELPLLGRNPYALAMLVPGVRPASGVNNVPIDQISTVSFVINGQRASQNEFLLDGAPNTAPSQNQPVINANPDSVQEFKVETNSYSAEYGRAAGGIFNVVTKSGTNQPHFSAYEFFRNDKLNANDYFANASGQPRAPFKFNQFGGTVGGPVVLPKIYNGRNRTFLFGSAELVRFIQGLVFTGTVPRPEQLAGDFSNARNAAGALVTIYDPLTTQPTANGGFTRTPFPGNRIPAERINAIARNISKFWPAPNSTGNPFTGVNNFNRTDANRVDKNTYSVRLDHSFTDNNRVFTRYSYDDTPFNRAAPYGLSNPASPGTGRPQVFTRSNAVIEDTHTFNPTLLSSVRYSFTRLVNHREAFSSGFDIATLGLPANLQAQIGEPAAFPGIAVTGYSVTSSIPNIVVGGTLGATDIIRLGNSSHALQGTLTKNLTRHTLKAGGEFRAIQFNNQQTGGQSTGFTFSPQWTQGPNPNTSSATAGLALASFLLGIPGGSVSPALPLAQTNKYFGTFFEDRWKVTQNVTVNLGIRWEYETPRTDRFNQLTNFDYNAKPPLQVPGLDLKGGLTFVGVNGQPRYQANPDRNNFSPRIGIAWKVTPKTVIRTGAGIFYGSITGVGTGSGAFGSSGFEATTQILASLDGVTPIVNFANPYPQGLNAPTGSSQGLATLLGQSITFYDRGNRQPYSEQWNFNIQRELPASLLFEIGYVGNRGLKLPQNRQLNQLPDSALALGDALRQQVPNPFFGLISAGNLAQRTVARAQLLRPYPQFDTVTSALGDWANSSYHALETKLEKRYSKGLSVLASYTWSKMMDYGIGSFAGEDLSAGGFQNWNNLRAEWSPSLLDMTHRFILNAVYELPFAKNWKGVGGKALGGWQVAGIVSLFSGGPLGVTASVNNTFSQGGGQRPNWTGVNPRLDNPTPQRWLDIAQFSTPPAYTFGNSPRTFNGTRSDGTRQVDFTLSKNTRFHERFNVQFRAEFFNILNTPRFAPPGSSFGSPQFGVVSSQGNQPRILQFALKLIG
ncbi:MAG: carboxypeptidase regulatory-like domain-containing protein [Acidobacteriota bacterium]|nr:carboxypeptidase regulatory-like domain-containing protein [Acidobacteriota bacterium]